MKNQVFFFTFSRSDYAAFRHILEINKNLKTQIDNYPSKKTLDFILSYSKSTKSLLANKFIVSLN